MTQHPESAEQELRWLAIDELQLAEDNVRRRIELDLDLAASIKAVGVLEPLVVAPANGKVEGYTVIAGNRRLMAATHVGVQTVPCIVRTDLDAAGRVEAMLIENLQRHDLAPLEEAAGLRQLVDMGLSQRKIAERIGRTQALVSQRLALLSLPPIAQEALAEGEISIEQARELTKLADEPERIEKALASKSSWAIDEAVHRYEAEQERARRRAELEEAGVQILDEEPPEGAERLGSLRYRLVADVDDQDAWTAWATAHEAEPCHAVELGEHWEIEWCTDPTRHELHPDEDEDGLSQEERLEAMARRREAEAKAAEARREFTARLLQGELPDDVVDVLTFAIVQCGDNMWDAVPDAEVLLGLRAPDDEADEEPLFDRFKEAGSDERLRLAAGVAAVAIEGSMRYGEAKEWWPAYLQRHGYDLVAEEAAAAARAAEDEGGDA